MTEIPSTMTAVVAPKPGGPEALSRVERPVPRPGHGEVLIKVAAAGLNGADLSQRLGRYELPREQMQTDAAPEGNEEHGKRSGITREPDLAGGEQFPALVVP